MLDKINICPSYFGVQRHREGIFRSWSSGSVSADHQSDVVLSAYSFSEAQLLAKIYGNLKVSYDTLSVSTAVDMLKFAVESFEDCDRCFRCGFLVSVVAL